MVLALISLISVYLATETFRGELIKELSAEAGEARQTT
jgi:hypothetical protein